MTGSVARRGGRKTETPRVPLNSFGRRDSGGSFASDVRAVERTEPIRNQLRERGEHRPCPRCHIERE